LSGDGGYVDGIGKRLEPAVAAVRQHLSVGSRPIWASAVLLVLLTWPINLGNPAPGLDSSWTSGLFMAVDDGKHFGSEVVFTYGPLGFLSWPLLWFSWLAVLAYAYSAAIYVAFAATLMWMLNRSVGLLAAALVSFLFLATNPYLEQLPLLLAIGWSFAALRVDSPAAATTLLVVGGGLLSGIEPLVKLSVGPPTILICLLGLTGARANRRQWSAFAAIALGSFLASWLLSGQALGNLWDYLVNGAQVISGYNEAMGFSAAPTWQAVAIVAFALVLVVVVTRADFRDSRARWFAVALTAVAAFVTFKYGTTQLAAGPVAMALSTMLAIFLMVPWPRLRAAVFVTASAVLAAIALHTYPTEVRLDVLANLMRFTDSAELAARPGLRQQRIDESRASLQATFAIDPAILAAMENKRVAIEPWETSVTWAYDLDWSPLPVFQSYVAYTTRLDRLNAAAAADPNGPQVILRAIPGGVGRPGFEGRQPLWDPPEQNLATACHFAPTLTVEPWQLLSRVPDRCGPQRLIASHRAEPGEAVAVPRAGRNELVVLRLEGAGVKGLERLDSLFWRPSERVAVLDAGRYSYRLIPGTSEDGLIVSHNPALDGGDEFVELPAAKDIRIDGVDRSLRFDFYRVPIEPPPRQGLVASSG
jgi:hypothetical protein